MTQRSYRSIGDVLTLLRGEFADITISKIRFLESQGLVSPQRSPSGYRKFFDEDVERLRYVLRQQRENFLPLKVIRDRLNDTEVSTQGSAGHAAGSPSALSTIDRAHDHQERAMETPERHDTVHVGGSEEQPSATRPDTHQPAASTPDAPQPSLSEMVAALQEGPTTGAPVPAPPSVRSEVPVVAEEVVIDDLPEVMTIAEVSASTGLDASTITALVDFGIVAPVTVGGLMCFDAEAVATVVIAGRFAALGLEPRHLRQFRNAVDREMGLIEQLLTPVLRQRNPTARARAEESATTLVALSEELRSALLARELRSFLQH